MAGRPQEIVFRLDPGTLIEGRVVDDKGRLVAGATVRGIPAGSHDPLPWGMLAVSDARGRFRVLGI